MAERAETRLLLEDTRVADHVCACRDGANSRFPDARHEGRERRVERRRAITWTERSRGCARSVSEQTDDQDDSGETRSKPWWR